MDAFQAYQLFTALKLHFTTDYDFVKYHGRCRVSQSSFDVRRDKYQFHKLSKHEDPKLLVVSNMLVDPKLWIGHYFDTEREEVYLKRKSHQQRLKYNFETEVRAYDDLGDALTIHDGDYPRIIKDYLADKISIETLVVLDDVLHVLEYWERDLNDQYIWPEHSFKIRKYKPFLDYEKRAYHQIIVDIFE